MVATGVAVASWPDSNAISAEPSVSTSQPAQFAGADREDRENRSSTRPSLSPSANSSSAAAAKSAAAKLAASKKAAASVSAAAVKSAEAKASVKAEAKASASASKAAASKAAASEAAASKKAAAEEAERSTSPAIGTRYATTELNVRASASASGDVIDVLDSGATVKITDVTEGDWRLIRYEGEARWVTSEYLSKDKPKVEKPKVDAKSDDGDSDNNSDNNNSDGDDSGSSSGGITNEPCSSGSSVEDGLTSDAILVHRTICANFPQVKSFGGVRSDSIPGHPDGRAVDSMISDSGVGQQIADYAKSHAKELGISEVIYAQRIWTVQRGSEGWRSMPDRGSASANHYDHVHVTVYGNAANG